MQYFHTIFNTSLIDMIYDQTGEFFTKSGKTTLMWKIYPLLIKIIFQINLNIHTIFNTSLIYTYDQTGEFFTKRGRATLMWTAATLASAPRTVALAPKGEIL